VVLHLGPVLTSDSRGGVEDVVWVVFVLDSAQYRVVLVVERVLEVRLVRVRLVKVCAPSRGHGLEGRKELVCHDSPVGNVGVPV